MVIRTAVTAPARLNNDVKFGNNKETSNQNTIKITAVT
jgi:hypothetical protein